MLPSIQMMYWVQMGLPQQMQKAAAEGQPTEQFDELNKRACRVALTNPVMFGFVAAWQAAGLDEEQASELAKVAASQDQYLAAELAQAEHELAYASQQGE